MLASLIPSDDSGMEQGNDSILSDALIDPHAVSVEVVKCPEDETALRGELNMNDVTLQSDLRQNAPTNCVERHSGERENDES